jgi:tetratricopeptide (TPR) repeat protein
MVNWLDALHWGEDQQSDLRALGFDFIRQGHYQRATVYYEALVALDPHSLFDLYTLGGLYVQLGDGERAIRYLERALEIDPNCTPALINKTNALIVMGAHQDALQIARRLAQLEDPEARSLGEALQLAYTRA